MRPRVFGILLIMLLGLVSCARVGSPNGGARDSIPPKYLGSNLPEDRIRVPISQRRLRLNFDEYIQLKNPSQNLSISPPLKVTKILPTNLATRYIEIEWDEDLRPATTYMVNFGSAIADNNEGNTLPYYSYVFSTGDHLDKGLITGTLQRGGPRFTKSDKTPLILVQLFEEGTKDFGGAPVSMTRVDEEGYFELDYLRPGRYELVAFEDTNASNRLDVGVEDFYIAENPVEVSEEKSISGLRLVLNRQARKARLSEVQPSAQAVLLQLEGNPEKVDVKIDYPSDYEVLHTPFSNVVYVLLASPPQEGQLFHLTYTLDGVEAKSTYSWNATNKIQGIHLTNLSPTLVPGQDWILQTNLPIKSLDRQGWTLIDKAKSLLDFTAKINPKDASQILISGAWKEGQTYQLTLPSKAIRSSYISLEKSYRAQTEVLAANTLGSFTLKDYPADTPFFLELWKQGEDRPTYSQYFKKGESGPRLNFLQPGTFQIVVKKDVNENAHWDAGDLATKKTSEPLEVLGKLVEIRSGWEMVEPYVKP